jgi:hypothetical protein
MLVAVSARKFYFFHLTHQKHMMGVRILMTNIGKLFMLFLLYSFLLRRNQDHLKVLCKVLLKMVKIAHQIMLQEKQQLQEPTG